ncbi:hypothetical protein ScPMuIL_010905 [Solemya velum]
MYDYSSKGGVPIVIDNGCYQCRAGLASAQSPQLIFKNITAKQRARKESDLLVGNDISNIEAVRLITRTQFDRNIVTQYDVQECVLDYIFGHLGCDTEGFVDHPVVMTEPVCNPNYCRQQMSELLFECYHVPRVAYGIDALFSFYANNPNPETANGFVVSCGYQMIHLLPVLNGRLDAQNVRRINLGGAQLDSFMQRLLQLKYPGHFTAMTLSRAEELVHNHSHLAVDYPEELGKWIDHDYYDENVHKIQLPFTNLPGNQLSADQQRERREQQITRLKDMNRKKKMEKLATEERKLQELMRVQELLEDEDEEAFSRALEDIECNSAEDLQAAVNKLTVSVQWHKAKVLGKDPPVEEVEVKKEPVYDLLEIPDDQLTTDQLVAKRRQKLLKNAREGRIRAQVLQRDKRQKEIEEENKLEQRRLADFSGWLAEVRTQRQKLLDARAARKQKKSDMAKRRTFASQQRMRIISQLAENTKKKDDNFGQNDADWDVYKEIHPENADSDSEAEEEKIEELESKLRDHDPEFQKEEFEVEVFDIAEYYRLHLAVERIRVPELLFQPSMIGLEQAGIMETMDYILKKYSAEDQNRLVQHVFLTGGNAMFKNFKQRVEHELLEMRPFQSTFGVYTAENPVIDSWYGAQKWSKSPQFAVHSVSRAEYEEKGGEYLKASHISNWYTPTPVLVQK